MKTVPYRSTWGNVKMRGRKYCGLSCYCCHIFNIKQKESDRQALKEAKEELMPR